jgi:hypothetical protein
MLPSRWADDNQTSVAEDGLVVNHSGGDRVCISANKPLPARFERFYFEITLKELEEERDGRPEWAEVALVSYRKVHWNSPSPLTFGVSGLLHYQQ